MEKNIKSKTKIKKIFIAAISIIAAAVLLAVCINAYFYGFMYPYREKVDNYAFTESNSTVLTRKQAEEDLDYIYAHLADFHPAWLENGEDEKTGAVKNRLEIEKQNLGDTVTVLELWRAASRIVAMLGDGHSRVTVNSGEDLFINDFTQLNDYGLPLTINGVDIQSFYENFRAQFACETESYVQIMFADMLKSERWLTFLGVDVSNDVIFTFETENGAEDFYYRFVMSDRVIGADPQTSQWVYYSVDEQSSIGIFTLKQCYYNDEYIVALSEFFNEIFDKNIQNIIVDLRGNGGGNSYVANEFLTYVDTDFYNSWQYDIRYGWLLKQYSQKECENDKKPQVFGGDIYILTDVKTYSAAMDFAMFVGDNDLGVIVGQASGNLPDSYGDLLYFQTPNAKLLLSVSFKKWYRIDQTKSGEPLTPDYVCPSEEALEKAYELILSDE